MSNHIEESRNECFVPNVKNLFSEISCQSIDSIEKQVILVFDNCASKVRRSCIGTWSALQQLRGCKFHTSGKGDGNWCSCGRYNIPPTENSTPNRMERDLKNFMIDYDACVFVQIISNYNFDKYPKNNGNNGSRVFFGDVALVPDLTVVHFWEFSIKDIA